MLLKTFCVMFFGLTLSLSLTHTHYSAFQCAHKWSQEEGIPALQDVLKQSSELSVMWADAQAEYIGQ